MSSLTLRIDNMHCGSCVRRVTQTLNAVPGVAVEEVRVGAARLQSGSDDSATILAALQKAGFPAHIENA